MVISVFNTALNRISKASSITGTGSQVLRGIKNPNPAQGVSGVLTALSGRSKTARKLLTIDSKFRDVLTKVGGIASMFTDGTSNRAMNVWEEDPNSVLNQAKGRLDPQMNFTWEARIISINTKDECILPIYIEEISAPNITMEQHAVFREGMERSYISGVTIGPINIKLYEDITSTAAKFMLSWANAGYSNQYGTFTGSWDYKKSIMISMLDPYGTVSARFVLGGCFPTSLLDGYDFISGAAAPISPTATLSVDTVECISIGDHRIATKYNAITSMASDLQGGIPNSNLSLDSKFGISSKLAKLQNSAAERAESAATSAFGKIKSFF